MKTTPTNYIDIAHEIDRLDDCAKLNEAVSLAWETAAQAKAAGDDGFSLFFSGEAMCLEGNITGGEELLRQASELLPNELLVLNNHAILLSRLGKMRASIQVLNQILDLDPDNLIALGQKGVCLSKTGYNTEALTLFDRVLASDPKNLHAKRNRGVVLSRVGREKEALTCFEEVLKIDPLDAHARSEKKILEEELDLKRTPLGWLVIWVRKRLAPSFKKAIHPLPK